MKEHAVALSRNLVARRLVALELIGFALAALSCWVTEYFDPPFSLQQVLILTCVMVLLGAFTIQWTRRLFTRIRYLEGFMVVCAACKQIKVDDQWVTIEHVMTRTSDTQVSDGLCPDCAKALSAYRL
jgi:hypothetical protein